MASNWGYKGKDDGPISSQELQRIGPQHIFIEQPSNGLGVAGFVLSLVGFLSCGLLSPLALLLSFIALFKPPRGLAIAGFVLGLVGSWWVFLGGGLVMVLGLIGLSAATDPALPPKVQTHVAPDVKVQTHVAPDVLTVLVKTDGYRIGHGDNPTQLTPATLLEVVQRAMSTPGSEQGIRVRILLHVTAQQGARSDLFEALQQAGLKREEIVEGSEFVE